MKRALVTAIIVICSVVAVSVVAQDEPTTYTIRLRGGDVSVKANGRELRGDGATYTKGVVITANGVRLTADRAVVTAPDHGDGRAEQIELEGAVRLSIPTRQ